MKNIYLVIIIVSFSLISCSNDNDDNSLNNNDSDIRWWVLVHPSYGNSGIYLYNETQSIVEKILPLPEPNGSPHALDFDGTSLWVGGRRSNNLNGIINYNPIYEIDPNNGEVISEIENVSTSGIAIYDNYLYYITYGQVIKVTKNGEYIESIPTETITTSDIAIHNSKIYYTFNGATDPIMMIDDFNNQEELILETNVPNLYTLAIRDHNFVVVSNNHFRRFDIENKEFISDNKIEIDGWITAIAPYN